jgi:addiction module RelE/StbE family toxin
VLALEWREAARADLIAIVNYIAEDNRLAAHRLMDEIEEKTSKLRTRPKLYRKGRVAGTREMVVRPSYLVVYTEDAKVVTILRVLHAAWLWPPARR